jgi:hypothetical protein
MQNNEILEAVGDDDWRPTARDIRMLNQGRKPAWAKKVTEIGPRKARPRTSTSPSELAMRRVTEPDYRKPFSETDLKKAREGEELMNARIADRLQKAFDDFTVSISADEISVNTPTVRFKVIPYGPVYKVKTIYSATRSEMEDCDSLYQVIELIKKNSQNIGESMNVDGAIRYMRGDATLKEALLDEALDTLKNIGATITEDTDDWDVADMPAGMTHAQRQKWAKTHNAATDKDFERRARNWDQVHKAEDEYQKEFGAGEQIEYWKAEDGQEGRVVGAKAEYAKAFNQSPENDEKVKAIFDGLIELGWKYVGTWMGQELPKGYGDPVFSSPNERYFVFKKPGKFKTGYKAGKKGHIEDYVIGFAVPPQYNKPGQKKLSVSYFDATRDGGGDASSPKEFVKEVERHYQFYIKDHKKFYRGAGKPDYEEMAALAYEGR